MQGRKENRSRAAKIDGALRRWDNRPVDERLRDPEECVRLMAMNDAWASGKPLEAWILEALLSCGSLSSAMRAAPMFAAWHPDRVEPFVLAKLDEIDAGKNVGAALIAVKFLHPLGRKILTGIVASGPASRAAAAAYVLYDLRDARMAGALIGRAEEAATRPDENPFPFIDALAVLPSASAREFMLKLLKRGTKEKQKALFGLAFSGRQADWRQAKLQLKSRDGAIRKKAAYAAGYRPFRGAAKDLTRGRVLDSDVAWALGEIADKTSAGWLIGRYERADSKGKKATLEALARIGTREALSFLRETANSPDAAHAKAAGQWINAIAPNYSEVHSGKKKSALLIIEPHCDDACFNCWGKIKEAASSGRPAIILGVFTRSVVVLPELYSELQRRHGDNYIELEEELNKIRNGESRSFAEKYGARHIALGLEDLLRRQYLQVDALPRAGDVSFVRKILKAQIMELKKTAGLSEICFPLGVGDNTDHLCIFEAILPLAKANYVKAKWTGYADQPYMFAYGKMEKRLGELNRLKSVSFSASSIAFDQKEREKKAADAKIFKSQKYGSGAFVEVYLMPGEKKHKEFYYGLKSGK